MQNVCSNRCVNMQTIAEQLNTNGRTLTADLAAQYPSLRCREFDNFTRDRIDAWEQNVRKSLEAEFPYAEHRACLIRAEWDLKIHGAPIVHIKDDLAQIRRFLPKMDISFWEAKCTKTVGQKKGKRKTLDTLADLGKHPANENGSTLADQQLPSTPALEALRRNEQEAWRKEYERTVLEWQLARIQKMRDKLLQELDEQFEKMLQLQEVCDALGIEPGVLYDASVANLCKQDIDALRRWSEWLKGNKDIRELCALMGRLRKEQQSRKREIIEATTHYRVSVPDIDSKEEIIGVELGNDLERILPQELALLGTPETSILFDLKFAEKRLMCFVMQGYQDCQNERSIKKEVEVEEQEKMGPIILCVDTSGSMQGAPENVAKAITLSLASMAATQKRACYLINFSTSITTLDLRHPKGIEDLIAFLLMSFHGGTDVAPALSHGVKMMDKEEFKNADFLVLSDFVMPELPAETTRSVAKQKEAGNKFYALAIGDFRLTRLHELFDQQWVYNPQTGGIAEINNVIEHVSGRRKIA
jgi:Uncharacterized protein containing a von Willebrand factor type A (vWA) domain